MEYTGREFDAVFISTCEEVSNSSAVNHTKSLSNHYVFNTVITRSKCLVVAIGNPYLLIKTEKNMVKQMPKSAKQCWTPFLRKCYDTDQLKISDLLQKKDIEEKYQSLAIFLSTSLFAECLDFSGDIDANDGILNAYTKAYECEDEFANISKYFSRQTHRGYDSSDENEIQYVEKLDCKFEADTYYDAKAVPLDHRKSEILIKGRRNRIGAFNGDIVTVGVFPSFVPKQRSGRVIKIVERVKNLTFVCKVSQDNSDNFYPIDAKNPTFKNFPKNIDKLYKKKDSKKKSHNQHGPVVIYSLSTMTADKPPKVEDIIEHKNALNMAFVIKFISWNPKYVTPFGVVIKAFHDAYNSITAECLLSIVHSVNLESHSIEDDRSHFLQEHQDLEGVDYPCAFTIDPQDAQNLDDAISLEMVSKYVYKLGVHIADVSEGVLPDSAEDKIALKKGVAVYYKSCGKQKMVPMLAKDTLKTYSLTPGNIRKVWSTTCEVHVDFEGNIIKTDNINIQQSQLRSVLQLSYEQAQNILNGTQSSELTDNYDSLSSVTLKATLDTLYSVSLYFSKVRFRGSDAMYWYGDGCGDMDDWQAHKLVEELMIWTNSEVAKRLRSSHEGALVRCQIEPENRELEQFRRTTGEVSAMSFNLTRYNRYSHNQGISLKNFLVPRNVINSLKKEKDKANIIGVASIVMSDSLFPQLYVASSKKKMISRRSTYCTTEQTVSEKCYCHFSLGLDVYTHFTSPLRRYPDIVVQRQLKGGVNSQPTINDKFCSDMNTCLRQALNFEKDTKRVELALSVQYYSRLCQACIESNTKSAITFGILCNKLSSLASKYTKIRTASLGPFTPRKTSQNSIYRWNMRITSLSGNPIKGARIDPLASTSDMCSSSYALTYQVQDEILKKVLYNIEFPAICTQVSSQHWKMALEFTKRLSMETLSFLNFLNTPSDGPSYSNSVSIGTEHNPFIDYIFSLPFEENETYNIWLSMRMRRCVPEPVIQIVELSPLCRICIQHNTHPAECFSGNTLTYASLSKYRNLQEYINLWQRVLVAEAAVASVSDSSQMFVLRDARLEWPKFIMCMNTIYDSCTYKISELISLTLPEQFMAEMSEYFNVSVGDLVCARYGYNDETALKRVFHFVVARVDNNLIKLELNNLENIFSLEIFEQLRKDSAVYELQIIKMCRSYR